ncbi:hypothetical protein R3W88_002961 [Solanum pinnatisectum]|uniref:Major facilitator superfamily (MFS) profile domain-containing protein n=1 Tax=Solanum pinnatisectum TaxID=50273 RepID=A0AAV9MQI2_9SOLN|nr:hypothetical protein R3W88_002961 [Solanum pinnatisectum]
MAGGNFIAADKGGFEYPGKLTRYVALTCIMAAMGGLIFGYDIGISGGVTSKVLLRVRKYKPQLHLSTLISTFQQLTGINVVIFYAPVFSETLGFKANASLMSAVITGAVNVGATFILVYFASFCSVDLADC